MSVPVGYGLPGWLDTARWLSAPEVRALGEVVVLLPGGACGWCQHAPATDRAHVARKGMGGQRKGGSGPMVGLCRPCHTGPHGVDRQADVTLAVERQLVPCGPGMVPAHRVAVVRRDGTVASWCGHVFPANV